MSLPRVRSSAIAAVLLTAAVARADAQDPALRTAAGAELRCRGRTDGRGCGLRFEPEFGAYVGSGVRPEIRTNYRIGFGGGLAHHVGSRGALGVSLWLLAHDGTSASVVAQYRHWMGRSWAVDARIGSYLGAVLEGEIQNFPLRFPSPIVDVGVSYRDWVDLRARFELLAIRGAVPLDPADPWLGARSVDWREPAVLVGARLGKRPGWIGIGVSAVVVGVIAATCCH
jgi:hypothetical protein